MFFADMMVVITFDLLSFQSENYFHFAIVIPGESVSTVDISVTCCVAKISSSHKNGGPVLGMFMQSVVCLIEIHILIVFVR